MATIVSCPACGHDDRTAPQVRDGRALVRCERCDVTWWQHPNRTRWSPEADEELLRESMARLRHKRHGGGTPASA